jgi:mannose-6-phosphate isomerase
MGKICELKNPIQEYAWGSKIFIPKFLGRPFPSDVAQAEIWMGAHPRAPSQVLWKGQWISLLEIIQENPEEILGIPVAKKFSSSLPFLFKVLAGAKPLSIQAHPNQKQAREGFGRENRQNVPVASPQRNYKDRNHKPELICALTPFWALKGFRRIEEINAFLNTIDAPTLHAPLSGLGRPSDWERFKGFFTDLMTLDNERKRQIITEAIAYSYQHLNSDPVFQWMTRLHQVYPGDIGVLFPIFLNLVRLQPGEAMFISPGELHTYLEGAGIELMANSDNVLRGALTSKHIDVPELIKILNFSSSRVDILEPQRQENGERIYPTAAKEFRLSVISVRAGTPVESGQKQSVEIMICTEGNARIMDLISRDSMDLTRGTSILVPAMVERYRVEGEATLYKATVPD